MTVNYDHFYNMLKRVFHNLQGKRIDGGYNSKIHVWLSICVEMSRLFQRTRCLTPSIALVNKGFCLVNTEGFSFLKGSVLLTFDKVFF